MSVYENPESYIAKELASCDKELIAERRLELDLEALLVGPTSGQRARELSAGIVRQGARAVVGAMKAAVERFSSSPATDQARPWCEPWNSGLASTPTAVGRRLGELLTALGNIDNGIVCGTLPNELAAYRIDLHHRLKAAGWRITAKQNGWKVLPPLTKRVR